MGEMLARDACYIIQHWQRRGFPKKEEEVLPEGARNALSDKQVREEGSTVSTEQTRSK